MRVSAPVTAPAPLPNEPTPGNGDDGWLGQTPPPAPEPPRCPCRCEPSHQSSGDWTTLPGETDPNVWDPMNPPLWG